MAATEPPQHIQTLERNANMQKYNEGMQFGDANFLNAMKFAGLLKLTGSSERNALNKDAYSDTALEFAARVAHVLFSDQHISRSVYSGAFLGGPEVGFPLDLACKLLGYRKSFDSNPDDFSPTLDLSSEDFSSKIKAGLGYRYDQVNPPQRHQMYLLVGHVAMVAGRPDLVKPLIDSFNEDEKNLAAKLEPAEFARVFGFAHSCESAKSLRVIAGGVLTDESLADLVFEKHAEYFTGKPLEQTPSES